MAINYTIQASIIDITNDTPTAADIFLVDTNVWYWMTYSKATSPFPSQLSDYPNYINRALAVNSKIHHSGLSLSELAHLIEKTEHDIYEQYVAVIRPKEYRHNLAGERSRVVSEIQTAWKQVTSLADLLAVNIDVPTTSAAANRFTTDKVDGYDIFLLESMKNNGVVQIITDDGDFSSIPGIQVFTANRNVINAARSQSKLVIR